MDSRLRGDRLLPFWLEQDVQGLSPFSITPHHMPTHAPISAALPSLALRRDCPGWTGVCGWIYLPFAQLGWIGVLPQGINRFRCPVVLLYSQGDSWCFLAERSPPEPWMPSFDSDSLTPASSAIRDWYSLCWNGHCVGMVPVAALEVSTGRVWTVFQLCLDQSPFGSQPHRRGPSWQPSMVCPAAPFLSFGNGKCTTLSLLP